MNNIVEFLIDDSLNDLDFEDTYKSKTIHKERFDDRFVVLYSKPATNSLKQDDYKVVGYFDSKDRKLYGYDYNLERLLEGHTEIKLASFGNLFKELCEKVDKYIEDYSFNNEEELENMAIEKYNYKDNYKYDRYKSNVIDIFLSQTNPKINLESIHSNYNLSNRQEYYNYDIFIEYLNNPDEIVEKYSKEIIDNNKEELGLNLLIYYNEVEYLEKIFKNEDDVFHDLYINKNILESIKDVDAKSLNITIEYNDKTITFKYDYDVLKRDLLNADKGSESYYKFYEPVSKFIKENTFSSDKDSRNTEEFLFSHITSITYGKNELYNRDSFNSKEEIEEEIEMEMG